MKAHPNGKMTSILNKDSYTEDHFMEIEVYETYQELETDHEAALKKVETKLLIINRELSGVKYTGRKDRIHQIQKRIKTFKSFVNKLAKKGLDLSKENIVRSIHDVAGLRVICSYTDDIITLLTHYNVIQISRSFKSRIISNILNPVATEVSTY
ncbi:hypothetical protein [Enterococcus sp. DIV0660C]|uniref:hypothetical protein n=1 Tax=Enterococcus sp. DIV0660C TaxID=2230880 RepID=UPI00241425BC|nr:hypothetical protein [Enterococcus sp. DIV0660C]